MTECFTGLKAGLDSDDYNKIANFNGCINANIYQYARPNYARPNYARPNYARPNYAQPVQMSSLISSDEGSFLKSISIETDKMPVISEHFDDYLSDLPNYPIQV